MGSCRMESVFSGPVPLGDDWCWADQGSNPTSGSSRPRNLGPATLGLSFLTSYLSGLLGN